MATPTLGNVPTTINACDSDNWTSCDGTSTEIYKENNTSVAWIARGGSSDSSEFSVTNLALSTEHIRIWLNHSAVPYLQPESGNGFEMYFTDGSDTGYWILFGSDTYDGGWFNGVLYGGSSPGRNSGTDPAMTSVDAIGLYCNTTGLSSNVPNTWIDYIRYGDGYYATGGTSGDKITLPTIYSVDNTNGYGILQTYQEAYFGFGEIQIGNGATTTYFEMLSEVLIFANAPVNTGLYKLLGDGSGCDIVIDNSVIRAAGSGDSTRFLIDMDETNLASFSMTDTFITRAGNCYFKSGQTVTNNVFDDCGQVYAAGADLSNCTVGGYEGTSDTGALNWNVNTDPDTYTDGMSFVKGTASTHAIEFGDTIPSEITLRNITFSGYNASNDQTDSTLYFADTGGTITVNLVGCSGNISYKSAGATVDLVVNPVTTTIHTIDSDGNDIVGARVLVWAADGTNYPYHDSVSIAQTGGTATVTHTAHGLATNDYVLIEGCTQPEYNGAFQITTSGVDYYTYTVLNNPSSPATGSPISTFCLIDSDTDGNGEASNTKSYGTGDQPILGRARKGSATVFYKTSPITGTVDQESGVTINVVMIEDE